jgi:hypothetical protein
LLLVAHVVRLARVPEASHPLEGSWLKLRWAKVNLDALQSQVVAFFGDESNADTPRGYLDLQPRPGPPDKRFNTPWTWPLLVGDIVHAFRASLDYLVWELARLNLRHQGKTGDPSRRTQFPIVWDLDKWPEIAADRLRDVGEEHWGTIDDFQPYKADDPLQEPLAWLARLSNQDKHQALNLVLVQAGLMHQSLEEALMGWAFIGSSHQMRLTIRSPEGEKKDEFGAKATFHISLEGRERIDWILDGIGPVVTEIVRAFEPVFERP